MDHHIALGTINPIHEYNPPTKPIAATGIQVSTSKASLEQRTKHFKNIPDHLKKMVIPFEQTLIYKKPKTHKKNSKRLARPKTAAPVNSKKELSQAALIEYVKIGRKMLYEVVFPKMQDIGKDVTEGTQAFNAKQKIQDLYKSINQSSVVKYSYCKLMERDNAKALDKIKEKKFIAFMIKFGCSEKISQSIYRYAQEMQKKRSSQPDAVNFIQVVLLEGEYSNYLKEQNKYSTLIGDDEINKAEESVNNSLRGFNQEIEKLKEATHNIPSLVNSLDKAIEGNVRILSMISEYQEKVANHCQHIRDQLLYCHYFAKFVTKKPDMSEMMDSINADFDAKMKIIALYTDFYSLLCNKYKVGTDTVCVYDLPKAITESNFTESLYKLIVKFINKVKIKHFAVLIYNDPTAKPAFTEDMKHISLTLFNDYITEKRERIVKQHDNVLLYFKGIESSNEEKIKAFSVTNPKRKPHICNLFFLKDLSITLEKYMHEASKLIEKYATLNRLKSIPSFFKDKQNVVILFDYLSSEGKDFDIASYEEQANKENEIYECVGLLNPTKIGNKKAQSIGIIEDNYNVVEPKISKYEVVFPTNYYERVVDQNSPQKDKDWYMRPHHVEDATKNPKSLKDDVLNTKYISFYEVGKKEEQTETMQKSQQAIEALETHLEYLKAKLFVAKQLQNPGSNLAEEKYDEGLIAKATQELDIIMKGKGNAKAGDLLRETYEGILQSLRDREREA